MKQKEIEYYKKQIDELYSSLIEKVKANGEYGEWSPKCLTETEDDFMFCADEMWHYGELEITEDGVIDHFTSTVEAMNKVFAEKNNRNTVFTSETIYQCSTDKVFVIVRWK